MAQHLSIGTAWAEGAEGMRREGRLIAPVVLGLILLPSVVNAMIEPQAAPGTTPEPGLWMVVALATLLAAIVGQMAVVLLINGWRGSVGESIVRAARRLPTVLLVGLVIALPVLSVMVVIIMFSGGSTTTISRPMSGGAALAVLVVAGLILFVAVRLLPMVAIAATGDDRALALLKRTWVATSGNFWKLFGFLLLCVIVFAIIGLAVGAVFGTIIGVTVGKPAPWTVGMLLLAGLTGLIQALFLTAYTAMLARIAVQLAPGLTKGI